MSKRFVVLKFGGTSVSKKDYWLTIAETLRARIAEGLSPIVVCSALSGISDSLQILATEAALQGAQDEALNAIKKRYQDFALELGVDARILEEDFHCLEQSVQDIVLAKACSAIKQAEVMALGELLLTRLGAAFLNQHSIHTQWQDVRQWLLSVKNPGTSERHNLLSASCDYEEEAGLITALNAVKASVILTQGFIARDAEGHTVLLGRGGSDTSAAYIAAKLAAVRCEIWTDVPGIYTTNPHWVPAARLIRYLSFDEAREVALAGAKVLHPYCIDPLRARGIPLYIRCTPHPEWEGTVISRDTEHEHASTVKAISLKRNVHLISMETTEMWRKVGFLADVFSCFKKHGVSVDLIATAEDNVTVSLDVISNVLNSDILHALLEDLQQYCEAKLISGCAVISLVGRNIRAILHQLAPMFSVFEEQKIYLLTQATNDLNLTFAVDEIQGERLLAEMHAYLFEQAIPTENLGNSWQQVMPLAEERSEWWMQAQGPLLKIAEKHSPVFVYDELSLLKAVARLKSLKAIDEIFYALKANDHPQILQCFYEQGLGFECVSVGELKHLNGLFPDLDPKRILFTPNFAARAEYEVALAQGVWVNLDNLHPLEHWPELFAGRDICVRLDLGIGRGHHKFVKTAGKHSKFGIAISQLPELQALLKQHQVRVRVLHAHFGSGVMEASSWSETARLLAELATQFPAVKVLDLGGGLGVAEKPGDPALDIEALGAALQAVKEQHPQFAFWLEPGRYLVAEAGVLLARVTQLKTKEEVQYIGIETGMNSLIRPMLYGAYHEIVNLTRLTQARTELAHIVGPICESTDTLGHSRLMPPTKEGDVLLMAYAGAYGHSMSSRYNQREPAVEFYWKQGEGPVS